MPEHRLLVVSPHLDDAVFACGERLARTPGSLVLTVFAGMPREARRHTGWDLDSGFEDARHAVQGRRREDRAALALLQARPLWLDFCDAQYGESPGLEPVAQAIAQVVERERPDAVLVPIGLFHGDHELAHEAALRAWRRRRGACAWLAYEDVLYRRLDGLLQRRLSLLWAAGVVATPEPELPGHSLLKARAVACFASQLRALAADGATGLADTAGPERCWRLAAADAGRDTSPCR